MRRYPILVLSAFAVLSLSCAQGASAWPLGKKTGAKPEAMNPQTQLSGNTSDSLPDYHKATAAEIQSALRADPLTQAAFFSNQFEHDPTDAQAGLYLSNAMRAIGHNAEAAETAHKVLLFAPNNVDALIAAARAHIADNNAFYAIDPLRQAIALKPKDWQAYSLLGVAYDQTKRPDDAQGAWTTALQLSPNNPAVLTNIAMAKVTAGDLGGAEPLLRTAVAQPAATLQIRQNLALVLGLEGKMGEAEKLLRQDLPPDQADANLAWLQLNAGKTPAVKSPVSNTPPVRTWDSVKASGS